LAVKRSQKTRKAARKTKRKTTRKTKKANRSTKQRRRTVKSSNLKHEDLGRLSFREHLVTKRERSHAELLEYERKYVSKFKKLHKTKLKIAALEQKLRLSQIELEEPKPNIKQIRKEYEKEYLTRYNKQQKTKPKKKVFAIR